MKIPILELISGSRYTVNSKFLVEYGLDGWMLVFYTEKGDRIIYKSFQDYHVDTVSINFDLQVAYMTFK